MNKIQKLLQKREIKKLVFNRFFFDSIKINESRWGMIINNREFPTKKELSAIAKYFGVSINELSETPWKK